MIVLRENPRLPRGPVLRDETSRLGLGSRTKILYTKSINKDLGDVHKYIRKPRAKPPRTEDGEQKADDS